MSTNPRNIDDGFTSRLLGTASSVVSQVWSYSTSDPKSSANGGTGSGPAVPNKDDFTTVQVHELMAIAHALSSAGQSIEMPRLCVVGSQSAGKSSVLNGLVGIDLLPTGGQMVTRMPLNMQLIPKELRVNGDEEGFADAELATEQDGQGLNNGSGNNVDIINNGSSNSNNSGGGDGELGVGEVEAVAAPARETVDVEFGDYSTCGDWVVSRTHSLSYPRPTPDEIESVRTHIERCTINIAGEGKNISHVPLNVRVYAPNVTPLAITDLPGMTMHALTDLGQPRDIKAQIRSLLSEHISQERTIIVAVLPAREDIEADPAIELVREADPEGKRTVGVLTKVDLMNAGTSIMPYLKGSVSKDLRFNLGYFAVRNRGPAERNATVRDGLAAEERYFAAHRTYSQIKSRCGTRQLAVRLGQALTYTLKHSLPGVLGDVSQRLDESKAELSSLGLDAPQDHEGRVAFVNMLAEGFSRGFSDALEARRGGGNYGRKVKDAFVSFREKCDAITPFDARECPDNYVTEALRNCTGNHMDVLVPPVDLIEYTMQDKSRKPIMRLEGPAREAVSTLRHILGDLAGDLIGSGAIGRFPRLTSIFRDAILSPVLNECEARTISRIRDHFESEECYVWTDDPSFRDEVRRLVAAKGELRPDAVRKILEAYYAQVRLATQNAVPKLAMRFMVVDAQRGIAGRVFGALPRTKAELEDALAEEGERGERRRALRGEVESLQAALSTLQAAMGGGAK